MYIDVSPYSERLEELAQKAGISESSWFMDHYYSRFYNILQISNENHITNDEFVYKLREFKSLYDGMSESLSTMACRRQSDLNIKEIGKYSNL